jgi:hypothetical protein
MKQEIKNFGYFVIISFFSLFRIDYSKRRHLIVEYIDRKLKVKLQKHDEYVKGVQAVLDKSHKKYKEDKFVSYAIEQSTHCNYVTFTCGSEFRFLQFWQGDGKIILDYPMTKQNDLGDYKYQVLGLLAENGFYKMRSEGKLLDYFFNFETVEDLFIIKANFARDRELATKFISTVMSEFYKLDLKNIAATVG